MAEARRERSVSLLFFASGLSALVYELVWARLLTLVFGNTVEAATTVLAAFMGGLAAGSVYVGRLLDRGRLRPLRVYALLEGTTGVYALLFPVLLAALTPLYRSLHAHTSGVLLSSGRFFIGFTLLIVPTSLIGGTFPAIGKELVDRDEDVSPKLGLLYGLNTLGGVVGVLLAGFVLIPGLGTRGTNLYAALINLAIAGTAWFLSGPAEPQPLRDEPLPGPSLHVLGTYFVLGFAALALEVVALRILILVFGSTPYALTVMLATFLTGIALGSTLARGWASRASSPSLMLGGVCLLLALVLWGMTVSINTLPFLYLRGLVAFGLHWRGDLLSRSLVSVAYLIPATLLFGASFPFVARLEVPVASLGGRLGRIYAANTSGAILGSVASGFVLLPFLGAQRSLEVLSVLMILPGFILLVASRIPYRYSALSLLLCLLPTKPFNRTLLSEGVYMAPEDFVSANGRPRLEQAIADHRLLFYAEGRASTVAVLDREGSMKSLRIDGKSEVSTLEPDRRLCRLMGHLPMLVHPNPKRVLNLGLGAGLTLSAIATHHPERIDVVEIEPRVLDAARLFEKENGGVLRDPTMRLFFDDGRNHLWLGGEHYDVITSDPVEPTVSGAASLFTYEHFLAARSRLAPGGVMAQFLPLYEMEWPELGSILKAFTKAFPYVSVFFTGTDAIGLGSEEPFAFDLPRIRERVLNTRVRQELKDVGLADGERLLAAFLFELHGGKTFDDVPLNEDNRPYLEFAAPRKRWLETISGNIARLLSLKQPLPKAVLFEDLESRSRVEGLRASQELAMQAIAERYQGRPGSAEALAEEARLRDPENPLAIALVVSQRTSEAQTLAPQNPRAAQRLYEEASALDREALPPLLGLARTHLALSEVEGAADCVRKGLALYPESLELRILDATISGLRKRLPEEERVLSSLLVDFPDSPRPLVALAELWTAQGHFPEAEALLSRALATDPDDAEAHLVLATVCAKTNRPGPARRHRDMAVRQGGEPLRLRIEADPVLSKLPP